MRWDSHLALHDGDTGVGGAQVHTDDLIPRCPPGSGGAATVYSAVSVHSGIDA